MEGANEMEEGTRRMAKVLIVDDNMKNIQVLGSVLREAGYSVSFSTNGEDALRKMEGSEFDIILLDIMMPGIDGYETCRRIRELPSGKTVPVIFLTAKTDEESRVKGFSVGAQDYVSKPFSTPELLARVRTHVELKMARDEVIHSNRQLQEEIRLRDSVQRKLERSNEKLKEADRIKNEFISILSHDMGTPITVIKGNLELIEQMFWDSLDENMKRILGNMKKSAEILDQLRMDTLDLSRMDVGTMKLKKEEVDMASLIEETVEEMRITASGKGQNISAELPDLPRVRVDRSKMKRAITNYLSNAVRYSGEGAGITVGASSSDDGVVVWVKDTGRGLPGNELEKVFERFYRTGERVEGSTGLGLAIVRGIVEAHGGKVWAESEGEGKGSTFFFSLPLVG